jgi:zinc/manganese transport system ATP-binding protein
VTQAPAAFRLESVRIARDGRTVVEAVTGAIPRGSLTAVTGPNGGGKSTLLELLAGRRVADGGAVHVAAGRIAWLPQRTSLRFDVPVTVFELVCTGSVDAFEAVGDALRRRAWDVVQRFGLADCWDRPLGSLSGGQLQRALFARLAVCDADTLLLDEPFSAVDAPTAQQLLEVLQAWAAAGRTIVVVLHDPQQIRDWCPQVLLLDRRVLGWGAAASVMRAGLQANGPVLPDVAHEH